MLDVLRKYNEISSRDGLLFFLQSIVGLRLIECSDAMVLCINAPGLFLLKPEALIYFCIYIGILEYEKDSTVIKLNSDITGIISEPDSLNAEIVRMTLRKLVVDGIIDAQCFSFDSEKGTYQFVNRYFPMTWSGVRNLLISCGFIIVNEDVQPVNYHVNPKYEGFLSSILFPSRRKFTLEKLLAELDRKAEAGDLAERYAFEYEKKRLGFSNDVCPVRRVSEIDVSAGYDIISFNDLSSIEYDRFIEVKAVSINMGFHWSINEIETARRKRDNYYLYLVELANINVQEYSPIMIRNPVEVILDSSDWFVNPESFYIYHA